MTFGTFSLGYMEFFYRTQFNITNQTHLLEHSRYLVKFLRDIELERDSTNINLASFALKKKKHEHNDRKSRF